MKASALASLLLLTTIAAACSHAPEAVPREAAAPIDVTTAEVAMAELPATFETGGIVRARVTAAIASRVMAPVTAVHVRAGDRVRRGAPLVDLDAREMRAHREGSRAAAAAAEQAALAAEADVASAQAGLVLARVTHRRIGDLAASTSATPHELDQATAALSAAEAQVRSAEARRASARASREAADAASLAADTGLSYTQLAAPFDGIVSQRAVDPGAMATPGAPLLTLEDPASFRVEAMVDESRAAQVEIGTSVEVAIGSGDSAVAPSAWLPARVSEMARVDSTSHAFVVKIDLPEGTTARSGTFVRTRFRSPGRAALAIPSNAAIRRGQLTFVFTVDAGSVARLRAISPGAVHADTIEVLAGVVGGETIVVDPPPALADGAPVRAGTAMAPGRATAGAGR